MASSSAKLSLLVIPATQAKLRKRATMGRPNFLATERLQCPHRMVTPPWGSRAFCWTKTRVEVEKSWKNQEILRCSFQRLEFANVHCRHLTPHSLQLASIQGYAKARTSHKPKWYWTEKKWQLKYHAKYWTIHDFRFPQLFIFFFPLNSPNFGCPSPW